MNMKVFITGGTGYVGSVLVERLLSAGHEVTGLSRSETSARALERAGATPVAGSLDDTGVLYAAAASADVVIHAAVDYTMSEKSTATELAAVSALTAGAGAAGTGKAVLYTSTGLVYGFEPDRDASEDAELPEVSAQPVKAQAERIVLDASGITPIVFRAGMVFGRGGSGLVTGLIRSAVDNGAATYIGDGDNTWVPIHVDDLADLYIRAIGRPSAGVFNAVGTVPFTFRALAEAIGALTGKPAVSIPLSVAEANLGAAVRVLTTSSRLVATKARETFGWSPSLRSLIDDVRDGSYETAVEER